MGTNTYRYRRSRRPSRPPEAMIIVGLIALCVCVTIVWFVSSRPTQTVDQQSEVIADNASSTQRDAAMPSVVNNTNSTPSSISPTPVQLPLTTHTPSTTPTLAKKSDSRVIASKVPTSAEEPPTIDSVSDKWRDDPTAKHVNSPHPTYIQNGTFNITTKMPTLPIVTCDYRIPMGSDGRPQSTSADLVLLFPYPTEQAAIGGIGKILTESYGFTTISIRFPGMGPKDGISGDDHTKWYYWPESGSGDAWIDAIQHVRKIGGFPDRPVFVTGLSGGGSSAGLFADAHPELVAAVSNMSGRIFSEKAQFNGPILLMHGSHDYTVPPILAHSESAQRMGLALTRIPFPPDWNQRGKYDLWQHNFNDIGRTAFYQWLVGVADLRFYHAGTIPDMASWPVLENNIHFPSLAAAEPFRQITPAAQIVRYNGVDLIISKTSQKNKQPKLVVFHTNNFAANRDEMELDSEYLSDNGWQTIAIESDASPRLATLKNIPLARFGIETMNNTPWILVVDEPTLSINPLLALMQTQPNGIIISHGGKKSIANIELLAGKQSIPILLIGNESNMTTLSGSAKTIKKAINEKNMSSWHREYCSLILRQINTWVTTN